MRYSQFRMVLLLFYDSHNLYILYAIKWGLNEVTFVHRTVWTWALRSITHRFFRRLVYIFNPLEEQWRIGYFCGTCNCHGLYHKMDASNGHTFRAATETHPTKNVYNFEQLFPSSWSVYRWLLIPNKLSSRGIPGYLAFWQNTEQYNVTHISFVFKNKLTGLFLN